MGVMELPERYDEDVLYGLVKSPSSIFFYWEISLWRQKMYEEKFTFGRSLSTYWLRVYQCRTNYPPLLAFTEEVQFNPGNYCVNDLLPGEHYHAYLGIMIGDRFVPMLQSNEVHTPGRFPTTAVASPPLHIPWQFQFSTYTVYLEDADR